MPPFVNQELRMNPPMDARAFDPHPRIAILLRRGHRIDDVEGLLRSLCVLFRELLPYEAPDRFHSRVSQPRDLVELVVLVEEGRVEGVVAGPRLELGGGNLVRRGLGHPGLVPDVGAVDERRADVAAAGWPGEHERL